MRSAPATPTLAAPAENPGAAGDRGAVDFAAEFERVYRTLWVVAAGIVLNRADADDVVQQAAVIGIRKIATFTPGTNFKAWMCCIVRGVAQNHRRDERRRTRWFAPGPGVEERQISGVAAAAAEHARTGGAVERLGGELDEGLLKALKRLEPVRRACLLLRAVEGMSYPEIAAVLEIPEGTAMSHVFRAQATLAKELVRKKFR